jgi:hypothetical protein
LCLRGSVGALPWRNRKAFPYRVGEVEKHPRR